MTQFVNMSSVGGLVARLVPFTASRLEARWVPISNTAVAQYHDEVIVAFTNRRQYVVYTHETIPLLVYDESATHWFGNSDTITTLATRHMSRCRPQGVEITPLGTDMLKAVVQRGYAAIALERMKGKKAKPKKRHVYLGSLTFRMFMDDMSKLSSVNRSHLEAIQRRKYGK